MSMTHEHQETPGSLADRIEDWFEGFARKVSQASGRPSAFVLALAIIIVWGCTGPIFHYSDTWQLVINTGTSLVTFLMVFLIQESQNHDTRALQVKLAELIIAMHGTENLVAIAEDMSERELQALHDAYISRAHATMQRLQTKRSKKS